ncbi:MAG: DUF4920 domain-containing protein [Deltaproteobacteria bacterium]|nr:DUF4920 domain-containing protein [Deltaproteobacteria bacterium]
MRTRSILTISALASLLACNRQPTQAAPTTAANTAAAAAAEAPAAAAHAGELAAGTALTNDKLVTSKTADGKTLTHAGASFSDGVAVSASELLTAPDKYTGKKVRVKGNVSAMCVHARSWFALATDDQSGRHLRVLTSPSFLVPADSIGKSAEAEGVVEVIEVAADQAKHFAVEHKLGDPGAITGPVKQVIVRASGADFTG